MTSMISSAAAATAIADPFPAILRAIAIMATLGPTVGNVMIAIGIFFVGTFAILGLVSSSLANVAKLHQPQVDADLVERPQPRHCAGTCTARAPPRR